MEHLKKKKLKRGYVSTLNKPKGGQNGRQSWFIFINNLKRGQCNGNFIQKID